MPDRPLEIRWLKRALANLDAEAAFIALDNPAAAARLVDTVARTVELLARNPGLGRPGRVEGTRELVVANTPYLVPYRVRKRENSDHPWHPEAPTAPQKKRYLTSFPFSPFDDLRVGLVYDFAHFGERLPAPVRQFRDPLVDQRRGGFCRNGLFHWTTPAFSTSL